MLRKLELQYGLTAVQQSSYTATQRSSYTANEQHSKTAKQPYTKTAITSRSGITEQLHSPAAIPLDSQITIQRGSYVSQRPPTKGELEMVLRRHAVP
ncbi:hypothetical protein [Mucilaginibacter sp.]|uniref:hypothetical protein n=1 Tax=Mucilaginibacter sp. TaxID=1882438 RepID=UPI003D0FB7C7